MHNNCGKVLKNTSKDTSDHLKNVTTADNNGWDYKEDDDVI